jgi:hypothetical protein
MNANETTYTTDTTESGREYVSEIDSVVSQTMDDGTEVVAEITTTASADDPTQIDSHMTVTETAPDGTETVYEVISNENGTFKVEDESLAEEIFEAVFDVEIPDELTPISTGGAHDHADQGDSGFAQNHSGNETGHQDFNSGGEMFGHDFQSYQTEPAGMPASFDNGYEVSSTPYSGDFGTADDGTTASDYLYTDTSFDVQPVETSVTAEDEAYNAQYNADYADYYQDQADTAYDTAVDYAEHGDYDAAQVYSDSYESHQSAADDWAGME